MAPDTNTRRNPWFVMSSPVRRYLLESLAQREMEAMELAEIVQSHFGIGWPAVSRQLKILHDSGFVRVRRDWSNRLFRLDDHAIDQLQDDVKALRRIWLERTGGAYLGPYDLEDDLWPSDRAARRPRDADEAIARIMREDGYDPETGKKIPAETRAERD